MNLVFAQHIRFCIISSQSPHEQAAVLTVIGLGIHLLILVCNLINGGISFCHQIMHKLNSFLVGRIGPVKIISAEHIYKLCQFVRYIGFLP